jgi:hypothetical protein
MDTEDYARNGLPHTVLYPVEAGLDKSGKARPGAIAHALSIADICRQYAVISPVRTGHGLVEKA